MRARKNKNRINRRYIQEIRKGLLIFTEPASPPLILICNYLSPLILVCNIANAHIVKDNSGCYNIHNMEKEESKYDLHAWQELLDRLENETGITKKDVCESMGIAYNGSETSYYVKLPRKKKTFIGIGMAYRQPLDVINEWIMNFGNKRRIYVRDISEDLVWAYLINANLSDDSGRNYFEAYEDYQAVAQSVFRERWDEIVLGHQETRGVEILLGQNDYSGEYDGIKNFVAENMDSFKSAYEKPRKFLESYVNSVLIAGEGETATKKFKSVNAMRGYLDDSMINYISGSPETINVIDKKSKRRSVKIKHVPKGRNYHIGLCVSLGMTAKELNEYLELMGYTKLEEFRDEDKRLLEYLDGWEKTHKAQRRYKDICFWKNCEGDPSAELTDAALEEIVYLKNEISEMYQNDDLEFPY